MIIVTSGADGKHLRRSIKVNYRHVFRPKAFGRAYIESKWVKLQTCGSVAYNGKKKSMTRAGAVFPFLETKDMAGLVHFTTISRFVQCHYC